MKRSIEDTSVVDIVIIFHAIKAYRVLRRRMDME
jgi:hypothetical protein